MTTKNDITGDKIQSKPSNKNWLDSPYWDILADKQREKEHDAALALIDEQHRDNGEES